MFCYIQNSDTYLIISNFVHVDRCFSMATFAIDSAAGRFPTVKVDFMWRRMGQTSESTSREKDKKRARCRNDIPPRSNNGGTSNP